MTEKFEWKTFLRIAIAFILFGIGAIMAGTADGQMPKLIIGVVLAGIGAAIFLTQYD